MASIKIGNHEIKEERGKTWLKIFHHNCTNVVFFEKSDNVLNISTPQKFSILGIINDRMKIDNKYEFLLEYPEINLSNQWRQSTNPVYDFETLENGPYNVNGYEPINIQSTANNWGGLVRSSQSSVTFLDGSVGHSNWVYPIGQIIKNWAGGRIPVAYTTVTMVYLWLSIDDMNLFSPHLDLSGCFTHNFLSNIIFSSLFIIGSQ